VNPTELIGASENRKHHMVANIVEDGTAPYFTSHVLWLLSGSGHNLEIKL